MKCEACAKMIVNGYGSRSDTEILCSATKTNDVMSAK